MQYPILPVQEAAIRASGLKAAMHAVPGAWEIQGPFNPNDIMLAVQRVVDAHDALRTMMVHENRTFSQRVADTGPVAPFIRPVRLRSGATPAFRNAVLNLLGHAFDLTRPPLWRGFLARPARGRYILGIAFARVIADAASLEVFGRDLALTLKTGARPNPPQLRPIVLAQQGREPTPETARWWQEQLAPRTPLPTRWRGVAQYRIEPVPVIPPEAVAAVRELARRLGVGTGAVYAAAVSVGASAALGYPRPVLGLAVPQRTRERRGVFGPLGDHAPVLGGAPADTSFAVLARALHLRMDLGANRRLPCEVIGRIAGAPAYDVAVDFTPGGGPRRAPIGSIGSVTDVPIPTLGRVEMVAPTSVTPVVAVHLRATPEGGVAGAVAANSRLFPDAEARALATALGAVIRRGLAAPDVPIGRLAGSSD